MVDSHVVEEEERNTTLTLSNDIPSFKLFGKRIVTTVDQTLPTTSDTTPENHPLESSERQSTTEPAPVEAVTVAVGLVCPRCKSRETKFCYFNNYNVNQPRHFCRGCHRYWTAGGAIRNVPIGAGRRKASNSGSSSSCSSSSGAKGGGSFGYSHDHDEIGIEESVLVKQWLQPVSDESVVGFLPVKRGNDIDGFRGRIRRPKV